VFKPASVGFFLQGGC